MRRIVAVLTSTLLVTAGSSLVASSAEAAPKPVTITRIPTQLVGWDGTVVVRPKVKRAAKVRVTKKSMTVRQGGRVVRSNRTAVRLRVGTYSVTTKISYTLKGRKSATVARQRLRVTQGRCATQADGRTVRVDAELSDSVVGDSPTTVARKLHHARAVTSTYTIQSQIDALVAYRAQVLGDPEKLADVDARIARLERLLARGVVSITDREYDGCGGVNFVRVDFANDAEAIHADWI